MDSFKKYLSFLFLMLCCGVAFASTQASRQYNFVDDRNNTIPITASRVDAELDNIITKLNQKVIIKSTTPASPVAGMLWYDSTNKILKQYRNAEWVGVGVHVSTTAPATPQEGDIWYDKTNNVIKGYNGATWELTLPDQTGHPNSYLRTDGSAADWDQISLDENVYGVLPVANGGTGLSAGPVDGILYFSGLTAIGTRSLNIDAAVYATPGTYSWTAPSGISGVFVSGVGAGGGGGDYTNEGGGGGSGAYALRQWVRVVGGSSYTLVVGSGGARGSSPGGSGTSGGNSTFAGADVTLTLAGGSAGTDSAGGNGGAGSGTLNATGGGNAGASNLVTITGGNGNAANNPIAGYGGGGGANPFGTGCNGAATGGDAPACTSTKGYGGGGGGAANLGTWGSNGRDGLIILEWMK